MIGTPIINGTSENINGDWQNSTTVEALVRHLAMLGRWQDLNLNGVAWSLVIEMRISLVFPALFALCLLKSPYYLGTFFCSALAYAVVAIGGQDKYLFGSTVILSLLVSAYYLPTFAIGARLAISNPHPSNRLHLLTSASVIVVVFLAIALIQRVQVTIIRDAAWSLCALALIYVSLTSQSVRTALENRYMQWAGKVSYSLYLYHVIVLNALIKGLGTKVEIALLAIVAAPVSLLVAEIANRLIEQPATRLGRAWSPHKQDHGSAA